MVKKITAQEIDDKLALNEQDYLEYYEAHKEDYVRPEQVRLMCITLTDKVRGRRRLTPKSQAEET